MIKQNKTKLQFILGGILMLALTVGACNGSGESKETATDTTLEIKTDTMPLRDSTDTMEKTPGKVSPTPGGN